MVSTCRNDFDSYEEDAKKLSGIQEYSMSSKRLKKRKKQFDEKSNSNETVFADVKENFKINSFLPVIDQLLTDLKHRKTSYMDFVEKFTFLSNLPSLKSAEIEEKARKLIDIYKNDIGDEIENELRILKHHLQIKKKKMKKFRYHHCINLFAKRKIYILILKLH